MIVRHGVLGLAILAGCAPARPVPAPTARPVASAPRPTSSPRAVVELPLLGLRVSPPGPLEILETEHEGADGPLRSYGLFGEVDSQDYFVARYTRAGRDRANDESTLANARRSYRDVTREAPLRMGEWQGIELEGKSKSGSHAWGRLWPVGDGFWFAQVSKKGAPVERAAAQAFLDSIVFEQPWSVRAFPEAHFSASLPMHGIRIDKQAMALSDFTVAEANMVAGVEERIYSVFAVPWEASTESTQSDEARMDGAVEGMTEDGNRVVWQGPIVVDGARGRDVLMEGPQAWSRLRFVVAAGYLYILQATSRTKEALSHESVPRFLDSLRWY